MRILFISYSFPPDAQVGGRRAARLCKYLPEFGIEPVVLSVEERYYESVDTSFPPPAGLEIVRTSMSPGIFDAYRWLKSFLHAAQTGGNGTNSVAPVQTIGGIRHRVIAMLHSGEAERGWFRPASRAGLKLLRLSSFDALVSSGPPFVAHRVARRLKQHTGLPWLADFRDPWSLNPKTMELPPLRRRLEHRMERSCVEGADRVICNTQRMRTSFAESYPNQPAEKFVTLPNGFEEITPPTLMPPRSDGKHICLHLGDVYAGRRIDTFCEVLARLVGEGSLNAEKLQVIFMGDTDPAQLAAAKRVAPQLADQGILQFCRRLDWGLAQHHLWSADLLLIFQGSHRNQIPAKFYEYLATGKPIFAVAEPGALSDILEESGAGISADSRDPEMIAARFLQAMRLPGRSPELAQQLMASRYHARVLAERLAGWLRDVRSPEAVKRGRAPEGSP
jgi:glycosyltransferase involved in cell wall biosynthesis